MAEDTFFKLNPCGIIAKTDQKVSGAGKEHLSVAGVSHQPITLEFRDPESSNYVTFSCKPVIIRGLAVPFLLAKSDLQQLKTTINLDSSGGRVTMKPGPTPITLPLVNLPARDIPVLVATRIHVGPGEERLIPVNIEGTEDGEEYHLEPDSDFQDRSLLGTAQSYITTSRLGKGVFSVYNPSLTPVILHKGTLIATACSYADVPRTGVMAANAFHVEELHPGYGESLQETRTLSPQELHDKIYDALKFNSEDNQFTAAQKKEITELFCQYRKCLALHPDEVGSIKGMEFSIDTGDSPPIASKHRPLPPPLKSPLAEQLRLWQSQGVIERSSGPWASPLVPVRKKDGSFRFAVDYRRINAVTIKDARPVANLNEKLATLRGLDGQKMKFFGTIDLSNAFHHIPVREEDRDKTAITTDFGMFRFRRMGFGLAAAPQAFALAINALEAGLAEKDPDLARLILCYFDDILICGESYEKFLDRLHLLLEDMQKMGFKINPAKCSLGQKVTKYLGHQVSTEGIAPDPNNVSSVKTIPPPTSHKGVRELHGLLSYFRKFIPNFASRTANIRHLLRPDNTFVWTDACEKELEDIKNAITKYPILAHPDFSDKSGPFILSVDTSSRGVGATLSQEQPYFNEETGKEEMREFTLEFASRRLTQGERSYSAYKLELMGLVNAAQHWSFFLRWRPFRVRTDHAALQWLKSTTVQELPPVVSRWKTYLEAFDFDITYTSATRMGAADGLSRRGYDPNDWGIMKPPAIFHEDIRDEEPDPELCQSPDNSFWVPLMKKKMDKQGGNVCLVNAVTRSRALLQPYADIMDLGDMPSNLNDSDFFSNHSPEEKAPSKVNDTREESGGKDPADQSPWKPVINRFWQTLAEKQTEDTMIQRIRNHIHEDTWPKGHQAVETDVAQVDEEARRAYRHLLKFRKRLRINNEIVEFNTAPKEPNGWRFILPESMFQEAMDVCHNSLGTAHAGAGRTYVTCQSYFYLPLLQDKVAKYVSTCRPCQDAKEIKTSETSGIGRTSSTLTEPLKTWSIDTIHMGDLRGHKEYIIIAVDPVTKWIEATDVKAANGKNVSSFICDRLIRRYGLGLTLIADKGPEYANAAVRKLVNEFRGKLHYGTPYNPQSNPIERFNLELKKNIRTILTHRNLDQRKWPDILQEAVQNWNHTPEIHTRVSPFYLVYRQHPGTSASCLFDMTPQVDIPTHKLEKPEEEEDDTEVEEKTLEEDPESIVKQIPTGQIIKFKKIDVEAEQPGLAEIVCTTSHDAVKLRIQKTQQDHSRNLKRVLQGKRLRRPVLHELLDWKAPHDPNSKNNRKLALKFQGPFLVTEVVNPQVVEIAKIIDGHVDPSTRRHVSVRQTRPTLHYAEKERPPGRLPSWIHVSTII